MPIGPNTGLSVMAENLSFSRFKAVFGGYRLCFGLLGRFRRVTGPDTDLRVMAKNLSFSRFRAVFMSYSPQFCDSGAISKAYWT